MINLNCENTKMTKKTVTHCAVIALILLGQILPKDALASTENKVMGDSHDRSVPSSLSGKGPTEQQLLTLNCLRDSAMSLQQIKQQAINIYLEATRTDVQPQDNSDFLCPKSISDKLLAKSVHYLPPRIEWLYFYVGTMEPVIQLFTDDISDTKTGMTKVFVPTAAKESLSPLWQQWSAGIQGLNDHLNAIYKLANEDKPDNIAIARHAVAMYKIGNDLERARAKATEIIRKALLKGQETAPVRIE